MVNIRKEMPDVQLTKEQFKQRFRQRFADPAFAPLQAEIDRLADVAWNGYDEYRKSPRTRRAGPGFADPDYQLSGDWIEASRTVQDADRRARHAIDHGWPTARTRLAPRTAASNRCPGRRSRHHLGALRGRS